MLNPGLQNTPEMGQRKLHTLVRVTAATPSKRDVEERRHPLGLQQCGSTLQSSN